ncbi:MAG: NAD(P)-binding protein [Mycobacterium sp.]
MSKRQTEEHNKVIGAGIAGLCAARVLSEHYGRVTILERDLLPDGPQNRRGTAGSPACWSAWWMPLRPRAWAVTGVRVGPEITSIPADLGGRRLGARHPATGVAAPVGISRAAGGDGGRRDRLLHCTGAHPPKDPPGSSRSETDPVLAEWFLRRFSLLGSLYLVASARLVGRAVQHNMTMRVRHRRGATPH